jgi:large repetitive protein
VGSSLSKPARRSAALRWILSRRRQRTSRTAFRGKLILVPVAVLALIFGAGLPQAASPATGASGSAPVAANDTATTVEDTPVDVNVLANDSDDDGDAVAISTFTQGANGAVTLVAGGLRYTPAANFNGSDSFTYRASDGTADSNVATVTVTVTEVNDLPIPLPDSKATAEDTQLSFPATDVLVNDTPGPANEAGQTLTVVSVSNGPGGAVTLSAGTIRFTPSLNFNGAASFNYRVRDNGTTNGVPAPKEWTSKVNVNVSAVNDAPVAVNDAYTATEGTPVVIAAPGVLGNDTDVESPTMTATKLSDPALGAVTLDASGSFTYTPAPNLNGSDSFTYTVSDGALTSNVSTVTLAVAEVNDAPNANADTKATAEDTALSFPASQLSANDSKGANEAGQTLTVTAVGGAVNGTVDLVGGTVIFTPGPDFNGLASFSYMVTDDGTTSGAADPQSDSGEVTVNVSEVNDVPTAAADTLTAPEDTALSFPAADLLTNDAAGPPNESGQSLGMTAVASPVGGTVTLDAGTVTFTPNPDFAGTASFSYTVSDNGTTNGLADAREATGTVNVTVSGVNDAPVAQDDTKTTAEDTTLNAPVPTAGEPDGETVTYALVTGVPGLTFDLDGNYAYVPPSNFHGTVSFTYKANDGTLDSNAATVTITVTPVDDRPVAIGDAYETAEDTPLSVPAPGVLQNDNDIEASPLSAVLEFGPGHGTLPLNANGSLSYTPAANFHGSDTFTYRASDGSLGSDVATVTVTVTPVNDAPVAQDDAESTAEDTVLSTSVRAASEADGDAVSYALVAGLPGLIFRADGSYTYAPPSNFHGTVSFTYKASDGTLDSNVATVTISVTAVNDAPVAASDVYAVAEDGSVTIAAPGLLANDSDLDSAGLTASKVDDPVNGAVTVNANGSFTYTPAANFNGSDTFTYRASDGALSSNVATVALTVTEANDVPVTNDDTKATPEDTAVSFPASELAANDSPGAGNEAGQTLTVTSVQGAVNGTVSLLADTVTFSPSADFNGAASFSYTVRDDGTTDGAADAREATGTVMVDISEANDAPSAVADTKTVAEDASLSFSASELTGNDRKGAANEDGQNLTVTAVGGAANGTVDLVGETVIFTPSPDFNGDASFSYTVSDDGSTNGVADPQSDSGHVSVTVGEVNDQPTAAVDTQATVEDAALSFPAVELLANDTAGPPNEAGQALNVIAVGSAPGGTVSLLAGTITFTPAPDFNGTAGFSYTVRDEGASDGAADPQETTGTVNVTVSAVNDAPIAVDDLRATAEDMTLSFAAADLVSDDSKGPADESGQTLTVTSVHGAVNGTVSLSAGTITFTSDPDFNGAASFSYTVTDDGTTNALPDPKSDSGQVTLSVTEVNDAPTAAADANATPEDAPLSFPAADLLTDDTAGPPNEAGQTLSVISVQSAANGTVALAAGTVTFTPNPDFNGDASFGYTIRDDGTSDGLADAKSASGIVDVTVAGINDAPVAHDRAETTNENTTLNSSVPTGTDVDGDALAYALVTGLPGLSFDAGGSYAYVPPTNFSGTVSFTYKANDGTLDSNVATVTITVGAVNDAPVAQDDSYAVAEDDSLTIAASGVLENDSDPDSVGLTATLVATTTNGTLSLDAGGSFTYAPSADFHGTDSFTYRASDGTVDSNLATVTIAVTPVNDSPSTDADSKATPEDAAVTFPASELFANDSPGPADEGTQTLTVTAVGGAANGTVTLADGSVTFTPDPDFNGTAGFTYTVRDDGTSNGATDPKSAVGTVTVAVSGVNDSPTAAADTKSTAEDTVLSFPAAGLAANDAKGPPNETGGQSLTVVSVESGANGTVELAAGTVTFTPAANFSGVASFTYTIRDDGTTNGTPDAKSAVGTVTVDVSAVNDAPVARADSYGAVEGTSLTVDAPGVLANDTDVDSASLSAVKVANAAHGTVTVDANGSFTYTPEPGFSGNDSFTYEANDGAVESTVATVTIDVGAVNDGPEAVNDAYGVAEDGVLTIGAPGMLANDTDVDSASLSATKVSNPANGAVALNANGSFSYTPNANFNGTDSFTYTASDGALDSSPATVTLSVGEVNDAPTAVADTRTTAEDTALSFPAAQLLANDSTGAANEGGQTLSVISVGSAVNGTVSLADGNVTITPDPDFNGPARFSYTVRDNGTSNGAADPMSAVATVTVDVGEVNDPPTAASDTTATTEDTALSFPAGDLAANDAVGPPNEAGQARSVISVQGADNGTVDLVGDLVTFTPSANFNGAASFTYTVRDNGTTSGAADAKETTGTVSVSVSPVNDAPAASNDAYETAEEAQLMIPAPGVLGNDGDVDSATLGATKVGNPANGSVTLNANGSVTYTPNSGFNGTDTFTYKATDGTLDSSTATVTITVRPVNDAPVADDAAKATAEDTTLNASVPAASDPDGDSLIYELVDGTPGLTFNANGSFTYVPALNFHGTRSFTYRATDGILGSNSATITITVTPVDDAPVAGDDASQTNERTPVDVNVLANDADVEGGPLSVASFSQGTHGSVARVDGKLRYTPDAGFSGSDSFTYRADDGALESNVATVTIDVGAVDDPPVANDQSVITAEDTAKTIMLAATDLDSGSLSYTVVARPSHGALSGSAPTLTYTPAANYHGADSFTFKASDGTSDSNLGTVTIEVTPVDDAPVVGDRSAATAEDTPTAVVLVAGDVDSASLVYSVVAGPSRGALSGAPPNLTYTPEANYNGPDSFTYRASDGTTNSNVATVAITVTPVNDAPIALGDAYSVDHNGTLTVSAPGLLGNDFDVESGVTAAAVANPSSGTLSLNANGSFIYTPSAGFSGTDTFTYRAGDGALDSNVAAVTITVAQAPPAPPPPPPPGPPADEQPPSDPVIESTSHKLNVASSDRTVDLTWSGASDDQSGVDGFSFHWDNQPVSVPDMVKDAEETATGTTSPPLSNGIWYFHLRTRDNAGNWTSTRHVAAFVISVPPLGQVRCVVPNLKGKKVAQARGLLAAGRCALARVTRALSRLVKPGRIVSQSRPAGARLPRGTKVSVVVSVGPRR